MSYGFKSAPERNRTFNLLIKSQLLCQLSYKGEIDFWGYFSSLKFIRQVIACAILELVQRIIVSSISKHR